MPFYLHWQLSHSIREVLTQTNKSRTLDCLIQSTSSKDRRDRIQFFECIFTTAVEELGQSFVQADKFLPTIDKASLVQTTWCCLQLPASQSWRQLLSSSLGCIFCLYLFVKKKFFSLGLVQSCSIVV